jgi:DNA-binding MarR family transcriptional regulator
MDDSETSLRALAELVERLGRYTQQRGFRDGLNPAQWAALRFLARASESARTVGAFARSQMTTAGTATQTMAALVRKGYVTRAARRSGRRAVRLDLTERGRAMLATDPLNDTVAAMRAMSPDEREALAEGLLALSRHLLDPPPADEAA